jgi:2-polyprenyl-3-methyl-5-hydroxy-6-metoxy-1,4-benzoquinol methylase
MANSTVDVVTLFDVAEHIPDDAAAIREALRVLRPGGHLLLTTPSELWRFPFYRAYRRLTPTDQDVMAAWGTSAAVTASQSSTSWSGGHTTPWRPSPR